MKRETIAPRSASRRYLAAWFPQLALDLLNRRDDPRLWGPFAVTERFRGVERIHVSNADAIAHGVRAGQTVSDARAMCGDVLTTPRDSAREASLLKAIQSWSDRYAPRVALDGTDGLALDITGCAHLFGGELGLAQRFRDDLETLKICGRVAIAGTLLAARGLARHGDDAMTVTCGETEAPRISELPVMVLDLDEDVVRTLLRLGVTTIAQLRRISPSELARRFSVRVPDALERLTGERADPLVPGATQRTFSASRRLPEPIAHLEPLRNVLEALAIRVCADLVGAGQAARGFAFVVHALDGSPETLTIGFARPLRDAASIVLHFARPLDALRLPYGADRFRLIATGVELYAHAQADLVSEAATIEDAFDRTLSTLGNRLGFDRLLRPIPLPGHAPEAEHGLRPALDATPTLTKSGHAQSGSNIAVHPRPERVWDPQRVGVLTPGVPPSRFSWQRDTHSTVRAYGPERVSPMWWVAPSQRPSSRTRDYWRVETSAGRHLWLVGLAGEPGAGWWVCGEFLSPPGISDCA